MKKLLGAEIRQMFLDFFKEKGHSIEPSASLVPVGDPTLLWINSGVATLKKYFDGRVVPKNPRIVNAQKCIRTNDIENVGVTARHHTFFEMLGNFSIGDYFKKEAIAWGWELLTSPKWFGFPEEKLYVTVYPEDQETYQIWVDLGINPEHIILLEGNFWEIGEGPCGPCTEIFYDRGTMYDSENIGIKLLKEDLENDRYLEVWNIVLSQFNSKEGLKRSEYPELPNKNIDTGMGLERMATVLQEVPTNYDSDLFIPIIRKTEEVSSQKYLTDSKKDVAFKIIADHIRSVSFAIGDSALPSNEGRGYILRRLIRRAVRYAKLLDIHKPFMYQLVPVVAEIMVDFYPEVKKQQDFIAKVIRGEEERFYETLNEGMNKLSEIISHEKAAGQKVINGQDVFKLYDTYGFPVELTEEFVFEEGMKIDRDGFEKEMSLQRERARSARQDVESMQIQGGVLGELKETSEFVGYECLEVNSPILYLLKNGELVDQAETGETVQIILEKTPFYAESGGQIADLGTMESGSGKANVQDVQKAPNGQNLHSVKVVAGTITKQAQLVAKVDPINRAHIIKNHTATHLLHQALKDVLGTHVNQAGSQVAADRLRFDFSHFGAVTVEEIERVEQIVNEKIWASLPVNIAVKCLEEAKAMGAMALFGEKYDNVVRVVQVGDYSMELCGGCHVDNSAAIGLFKIISETGIGAGIRRIEAATGQVAYQLLSEQVNTLKDAASLVKASPKELPKKIEGILTEMKELQKNNESLLAQLANIEAKSLENRLIMIHNIPTIIMKVNAPDMASLRHMTDELKTKLTSAIIVLGSKNQDRVNLIATVSQDLIKKGYHAGNLIKEIAQVCDGSGGGRPDMAQAGGKNPSKLDEALDLAKNLIVAKQPSL